MREATEGAHRRDKQHITPRQEEEVDRRVVQPGGTGLQPWAWVAVWGHGVAAWLNRLQPGLHGVAAVMRPSGLGLEQVRTLRARCRALPQPCAGGRGVQRRHERRVGRG